MTAYWVVGGTYTDTTFQQIAGGGEEDWFGPFATYDEAKSAWAGHAWRRVDDCNNRYRIVESEAAETAHAAQAVPAAEGHSASAR